MEFGFYLYQQGAITSEQLVEAMVLQSEGQLPLGVVALESNKLEIRDVLSILRVQSDLPNDRFGDIAIELGLLNKRDLAELLMLQSERNPRIGDCLVDIGAITQQQMETELAAYRRERERGGTSAVQQVVHCAAQSMAEEVPV